MRDEGFKGMQAALVQARRDGTCIPTAAAWIPQSPAQAYALQQAVATELGEVKGWKVSGLTPQQQAEMGVTSPLAAPLLGPWLRPAGAVFERQRLVRPRLECEFAFELHADLPPRDAPYTRDEVEDAIAALRIGVEIVDSRLPAGSPVWLELADNLNNGGYVVGPAWADWRSLHYAETGIVLRRLGAAGDELARGDGRAVLDGDPVGAVVLLANLDALQPRGLRAGDLVTTGSCTGAVAASQAGDFEADFGRLGSVRFSLVD